MNTKSPLGMVLIAALIPQVPISPAMAQGPGFVGQTCGPKGCNPVIPAPPAPEIKDEKLQQEFYDIAGHWRASASRAADILDASRVKFNKGAPLGSSEWQDQRKRALLMAGEREKRKALFVALIQLRDRYVGRVSSADIEFVNKQIITESEEDKVSDAKLINMIVGLIS